MNVSAFCIKHKVTTILAFIIISIYGFTVFSDLKLTLLPEIRFPSTYVMCTYHGAGPEDVEELVTRPIEASIATITGVKDIDSTSSEGVSVVMVTYEKDTNMDMITTKLREKFDLISFPEGCNDPMIYNLNINDLIPVMYVAVMDEDLAAAHQLSEQEVIPSLERISGVASVNMYGGVKRQITVATDSARLSKYGLSIMYLSQNIASSNILYPGGDVNNGEQILNVSVDAQFNSVEDVANTLIPLPIGGTVRLTELADVYFEDVRAEDTIANTNGEDSIFLGINRQSDANEVQVAEKVRAALEEMGEKREDLNYSIVFDTSEFINRTAENAVKNIVLGVLLAAVVVYLFLRKFGATTAIAISMPFCILVVFVTMYMFDVTLNMISLGGIAMGVGMIVDNSIVVLENIYRYSREGYSRFDACTKGTKEVTLPVTASTLTTIAVFLPIALNDGLAGMLFRDFALTVVFLLLGSLVIALTLVPLLSYMLLDETKVVKPKERNKLEQKYIDFLIKTKAKYLALLTYFIRKRRVAVLVSTGLVVIFVISIVMTEKILMPEADQGELSITVSTPVGTKVEESAKIADKVVAKLQENCPELDYVYYTIELGNVAVSASLVDLAERDRSSIEIANDLRYVFQDIAGCEISVSTSEMTSRMMGNSSDISVKVIGRDYDMLARISEQIKIQIENLDGAVDVKSSIESAAPAVKVYPKRDQATSYGISAQEIAMAVHAELTGETATNVTLQGNDLSVVIKGNEIAANSLDALRSMILTTNTGAVIPLSAVADVEIELIPQNIARSNQSRQVEITGNISDVELAEMTQNIQEIIESYDMPSGYYAEIGGTYEDMAESYGDLLLALVVALGLVYFILASQFESFIMPVIVMMILPVALTGALFGLPITGSEISLVAGIGVIMLAGVVVNASIILVDYIKVRRRMGESKEEAILEACPLRIRPIMMTALTTILAMLPMSLGIGEGAEMMQPMSIVMISGMIVATIVTLLFTPVYYSLLDSLSEKTKNALMKTKMRIQGKQD